MTIILEFDYKKERMLYVNGTRFGGPPYFAMSLSTKTENGINRMREDGCSIKEIGGVPYVNIKLKYNDNPRYARFNSVITVSENGVKQQIFDETIDFFDTHEIVKINELKVFPYRIKDPNRSVIYLDKLDVDVEKKELKYPLQDHTVREFTDKCMECGNGVGRRLKEMKEEIISYCHTFCYDGDITAEDISKIMDKYFDKKEDKE